MSFHLVPHLPRLDAMVSRFLCVKKSEQFDLLFLSYFIFQRAADPGLIAVRANAEGGKDSTQV